MRSSTAAARLRSRTKAYTLTMSARVTVRLISPEPPWTTRRNTSAATISTISTRCSSKRLMRLTRPWTFRNSTETAMGTSTACTCISPVPMPGGEAPGGARNGRCRSRPRPRCTSVRGTASACGTRACWRTIAPRTWQLPRSSTKRATCSAFPICIAIGGRRSTCRDARDA